MRVTAGFSEFMIKKGRFYLGLSKLPGLFSVPRHSGLRSLLASDKARFTPVTSKSLQ